jgi:hypothetical protein
VGKGRRPGEESCDTTGPDSRSGLRPRGGGRWLCPGWARVMGRGRGATRRQRRWPRAAPAWPIALPRGVHAPRRGKRATQHVWWGVPLPGPRGRRGVRERRSGGRRMGASGVGVMGRRQRVQGRRATRLVGRATPWAARASRVAGTGVMWDAGVVLASEAGAVTNGI